MKYTVKRQLSDYADIITMPHHVSTRHVPMPLTDRAAQFSPFAALTGHDDAIRETERLTESERDFDEGRREALDEKIRILISYGDDMPVVEVTYFEKDLSKEGGKYVSVAGRPSKIDLNKRQFIMECGNIIAFKNITGLAGKCFDDAGFW